MKHKETKLTTINNTAYVRVPYEVFTDSSFPFKADDELVLEIRGKEVVVSRKKR